MSQVMLSSRLFQVGQRTLHRSSTVTTSRRSLTTTEKQESDNNEPLIPTWDAYFKLRSKRRKYEIVSYFPSTTIPMVATGAYFMQLQIDPFSTFMGMDPLMAAALSTIASGFCGYLLGPVLGDVGFKCMNRKYVPAMDERDKAFYEHVKRNRSSARLNSIRNPVPDYYGEKINSVADYRSWLRKQREHYRKGVFGGNVDEP
ncbi:mitochondrial import protein Pam17 [Phascolomyces articulosus]|uniref:Presequence translocated-associated motor subunit PAM17 n=1 Tax=Phascolomyces articulosus TaxID=60185 RepID=A0AAD5PD87_9FUNG|nr:mitochondrial import protein Pam17 [Phascolomyces articulosus]